MPNTVQQNVKSVKELFQKVHTDGQYHIDRFKVGSDAELVDIALLNKNGGADTVYGNEYDTTDKYERDINGNVVRQDLASYQHDFEQYVKDVVDNIEQEIANIDLDPFTGATDSTNGTKGMVPAPQAGDENKYLRGDGTWAQLNATGIDLMKQTVGWVGKNIIPVPYYDGTTKTDNGITFTVNSNGTIVADGTASDDAIFILHQKDQDDIFPEQGDYILSGGIGSANKYISLQWRNALDDDWVTPEEADVTGNGCEITRDSNVKYQIAIKVLSGTTVDNEVFEPMIRFADVTDDSYEPYHISVQECIEILQQAINNVLGEQVYSTVVDDTLVFTDPLIITDCAIDGPYINNTLIGLKDAEIDTENSTLTYTLSSSDADGASAYIWIRRLS